MQKLRPKAGSKKRIQQNQQGFITLIIFLVIVLVAVLALAYLRVVKAQH